MTLLIFILIAVCYFILIIYLIIGFNKVSEFKISKNPTNKQFSIIIPFRNEAKNIMNLCYSLSQINYDKNKYEIIFVDDDSTDNSVEILNSFLKNNKYFKLITSIKKGNQTHLKQSSPKKRAINDAIKIAKYNWLITTDADCEVPTNWLNVFSEYITNNPNLKMIVAPVVFKSENSFFQNFQKIDFLSLIGATIGGFGINKPFLCNGANLCYKKETFNALNGFNGNENIASGDDVFLMEKFLNQNKNWVSYLKSKDAIVITKPEKTFKRLVNQRIRWASKTSKTKNKFGKLVGILVFLMNFFMVLAFGFSLFVCFLEIQTLSAFRFIEIFIIVFLIKFYIDFILIQKTHQFMGLKNRLKPYIFSSILYPFFVVFIVFLSIFKKYEWKERVFKK